MALPKLTDTIASFERRRTNVLRHVLRAGPTQGKASRHTYQEAQLAAGLNSSTPICFTLTQVLDAFLGQADAGAYVVLARRIDNSREFDFDSGVEIEELEAKSNFDVVHKYVSETLSDNVSAFACANLVLKIVIELYGDLLEDFPMSEADRLNLDRIKKVGRPLRASYPTRRVGAVPTEINAELLREVPPSIRKVYEASAAWETAKKESEDLHRAGALQAFSLM